ncbi:hypothetical protein ABZX30_19255 [Streptomyces sp. NPDC004542]|uniref:hypothetical protein n=1 Tax=Streptomyces sp. NPDC004542 TaxID=3154281 RepID=UPI0033B13B44
MNAIVVDMSVNQGACNGCKVRQQLFANDLKKLFPSADVRVNANYSSRQPAVSGRSGTSVYGYKKATPMDSAAGAQIHPGASSNQYHQYAHKPNGRDGWVPNISNIPPVPTNWRSDADSPHVSPSDSPSAEQELKHAEQAVTMAENKANKWKIAKENAERELNNASTMHGQKYEEAYTRIAAANPLTARDRTPEDYRERIRKQAESVTHIYKRPVEEATAKLREMQRGLGEAQRHVHAAKDDLTRVMQQQAAAGKPFNASTSTSTQTQRR